MNKGEKGRKKPDKNAIKAAANRSASASSDEPDAATAVGNATADAEKVKATYHSPTERLDESHQQHLARLDEHCKHFMDRAERAESLVLELKPRVAELEQAERTGRAFTNWATAAGAIGAVMVSSATLWDSGPLKFSVWGIGIGFFFVSLWLARNVAKFNWPSVADDDKTGVFYSGARIEGQLRLVIALLLVFIVLILQFVFIQLFGDRDWIASLRGK